MYHCDLDRRGHYHRTLASTLPTPISPTSTLAMVQRLRLPPRRWGHLQPNRTIHTRTMLMLGPCRPKSTPIGPGSPYDDNSAAATSNLDASPSSSATPPWGHDEPAWLFGPEQSIYHPTFLLSGGQQGKWDPQDARYATRTRHKPAARILNTGSNNEPKQPVRGVERLATPDWQGFHHRSLLGPSLQQGWAVEATDGQLIWVEGSVEEEMAHRIDSTVQQEYLEIPKNFKTGYQALLVATQAD
ncbi:hypothetical protein BGY98DRAFT_1190695 [Russula aff. rugulosa BPL654]|nr:hypothetical protein BGY98DRAFT_1190695 [Russula aff. rugulosa BPL654]